MLGFNPPFKRFMVLSKIALLGMIVALPLGGSAEDLDDSLTEDAPRIYVRLLDLAYQAFDNAKYSFAWHSSYFPKKVDHQVTTQHDALFDVSTMVELEPNLLLNTDLYATLTTESHVLRGIFSNPQNTKQQSKFIDFKQLYVMYRIDSYDLSAGKMLISNEMAELSSITDIFNEQNFIGYQDPITVGTWHLRADYYTPQNDQISVMLLPLHVRDNILPGTFRFYGDTGGYVDLSGQDPALFTGVTFQPTGFSDSTLKNWSWYGKYSGNRQGLDFFGGVYLGNSPYNVARTVASDEGRPTVIELRKPRALEVMGGVGHAVNNVRLYAETLAQWTFGGADDSFIQLLGGIHVRDARIAKKLQCEDVSYTLELGFDKQIKKQNDTTYYFSSNASRKSVSAFTEQVVLKKDDIHSGFFGLTFNYKDKGRSYFVGSRYNYNDSLYGQLSLHLYGGSNSSTLGRWNNNRSLQFALGYDF